MPEIDEKEIERRFETISKFELEPEITIRDLKQLKESLTERMSKQQARTKKIWRIIMKSSMTKLSAAGIIIAAVITVHQLTGSIDGATRAWAEVVEATKNVIWMHTISDVTTTFTGDTAKLEKEHQESWTCFKSKAAYRTIKGRSEYVDRWDFGENKRYTYSPQTKTIVTSDMRGEMPVFPETPVEYAELLTQVRLAKGAKLSRQTGWFDKTKVEIWEITGPSDGGIADTKLFIDAETHLPIAHKTEYTSQDGTVEWNTKFEYPENGPDSIYALGVPRTAEILNKKGDVLTKKTDDTKLVALDIQLPKAMFAGTPQDNKVENLEKPLGKPRPPFLAPVGTKNIALGKPVSSSDEEPIIGQLDMITDGDKEAPDGSYVELGPFPQQVTIDLGAIYKIYAIVVWHYHKQPRVYFDVVVQVTDDKYFITNVKTLFNNDIDNSAGLGAGKDLHYIETNEGKLIDAKGVKARYVRLYSNGNINNDLNHYIEVEVYGKPVK